MKHTHAQWLPTAIIVAASFVALQLIANVASTRIVMVGPFSIDGGTIVYPLIFTVRDLVQKVCGKTAARAAILAGAALNLLLALTLQAVAWLPADQTVGPQEEFGLVLTSAWRIVAASIIAGVLAELIDTEVYSAWVNRFGNRLQYGRVLTSNAVSVPVDTAAFVLLAFLGEMPAEALWAIFLSNVALKYLVSVAFGWLIYTVPQLPTTASSIERAAAGGASPEPSVGAASR